VTLFCAADGRKLPPVIHFKGKTQKPKLDTKSVRVRFQEKAWINSSEFVWMLENNVKPYVEGPTLLIFDTFRAHLTDEVKDWLKENKIDWELIPPNLTSKLQPLDVNVKHPFKSLTDSCSFPPRTKFFSTEGKSTEPTQTQKRTQQKRKTNF
jgi:hypothetical protein